MSFRSSSLEALLSPLQAIFRILILAICLTLAVQVPAEAQEAGAEAASEEAASGEATNPAELQTLIDTLQNEESRNRLIEQLQSAAEEAQGPVEAVDDVLLGNEEMSLGRRIADTTRYFAEDIASSAVAFWNRIAATPAMFSALDSGEVNVLASAFVDLLLVIISTYAIFLVLRSFAKGIFRSMGARSVNAGLLQRIVFIVLSLLVDAFVVIVAWAAGYAIALFAFGEAASMGIRQTLYLNAFLLVELFKVFLRFVLSPSTGDLRPIPVGDQAAKTMNRGFTWIIGILGYGQLLVLPIVNQDVSFAAGQAISALISLVAVIIAVVMTIRHRGPVAHWLLEKPEVKIAREEDTPVEPTGQEERRNRHIRFMAHRWHWPVMLYLAFLFVVVLVSPPGVLLSVLGTSAQVLLAVVVGFAVAGWIARAIARGINLPERVNQRLPLLERRLNAFVPKMLTVLRVFIFLIVSLFVLNAVNVLDIHTWLQSQVGVRTTSAIVSVFFIVVVAFALWLALNSWIDYRLNPDFGRPATLREQTLLSLLRNAATVALLVIALMFALSEIGINIAPLIASAGVLGLAIGFGAQKLVQDIITGVFVQLENAMNVGDVVDVNGTSGTVERLTVRSVSLRGLDASYHIIPFSSIDMVTNFMRDYGYHVAEVGIAYRENVEDAHKAMLEAFEELKKDKAVADNIIGDLEWFGVTALADSSVNVRARIKTKAGSQWGVGRAYNAAVKRVFDAHDIEIPFPHQTVFFGIDKHGNAPAAHIQLEGTATEEGAKAEPAAPNPETPLQRRRRKRQVLENDVPDDEDES